MTVPSITHRTVDEGNYNGGGTAAHMHRSVVLDGSSGAGGTGSGYDLSNAPDGTLVIFFVTLGHEHSATTISEANVGLDVYTGAVADYSGDPGTLTKVFDLDDIDTINASQPTKAGWVYTEENASSTIVLQAIMVWFTLGDGTNGTIDKSGFTETDGSGDSQVTFEFTDDSATYPLVDSWLGPGITIFEPSGSNYPRMDYSNAQMVGDNGASVTATVPTYTPWRTGTKNLIFMECIADPFSDTAITNWTLLYSEASDYTQGFERDTTTPTEIGGETQGVGNSGFNDAYVLAVAPVYYASSTWEPADLDGLVGWWDADDSSTITESSNNVSNWADKSPAGHDLVSSSSSGVSDPATGSETMNGRNVLTFALGEGLDFPSAIQTALDSAGAGELFYVFENDHDGTSSGDDRGAVIQGGTGGSSMSHVNFSDGNMYQGWGTSARKSTGNPSAALTSPHLMNVRTASGSYVVEINGSAHYSTATNTVDFTTSSINGGAKGGGMYLCHADGTVDSDQKWRAGKLAEILIFDRVLTSDERDDIEGYLNPRWLYAVQAITPSGASVSVTAGTLSVSTSGQDITPTGASVSVTAGTLTVSPGAAAITPTGASVTLTAGTLTVNQTQPIAPTGATVTVTAGTLTVAPGAAAITPTGATVTVTAGTLTVFEDQPITPTGASVTVTAGTLTITQGQPITPTGATVTVTAGTLTVFEDQAFTLTGASVSVTAGTPSFTQGTTVEFTGPTVSVTAGTLTVAPGEVDVTPTGASVTVTAGTLEVDQAISVTGASVSVTAGSLSVDMAVALTGATVTVTAGTAALAADQAISLTGATIAVTAGSVSVVDAATLFTGTFVVASIARAYAVSAVERQYRVASVGR